MIDATEELFAPAWFGPDDDLGALTDFVAHGGDLEGLIEGEAELGIAWR